MQIHRVHGKSLTEALKRARDQHGDGAVVLSQETLSGGGVTIAVSEPSGVIRRRQRATRRIDPGLKEVCERLVRSGASAAVIKRVSGAIAKSGVKGAYALDVAARVLGKAFLVQPSPKRTGTRVIVFIGPSGAGKTTTMAKLGRRLVEGGRSVFFASLDGVGVGELQRLTKVSGDADRHEIPIQALRSTAEIDEQCAVQSKLDVLLLDTPGHPLRDDEGLASLGQELERLGTDASVEIHLVLPASDSRATLDLALDAFSKLKPDAIVITKLDETPRPATVLERCMRARLPISFLCAGPDVRGDLRRARGDHFADLLLRGRITR